MQRDPCMPSPGDASHIKEHTVRTRTHYTVTTALLALITPFTFIACSDDAGSSSSNATTNKAAENMNDNSQQANTDKTTFEVETKDNTSGMTTKEENSIEDKNASQANSGGKD